MHNGPDSRSNTDVRTRKLINCAGRADKTSSRRYSDRRWSSPRKAATPASGPPGSSHCDRAARYRAAGHPSVRLASVRSASKSGSNPARRNIAAASADDIARSLILISTSARCARNLPIGSCGSVRDARARIEPSRSCARTASTTSRSTSGATRCASSSTTTQPPPPRAGARSRPAATAPRHAMRRTIPTRATRTGARRARPSPKAGPIFRSPEARRSKQAPRFGHRPGDRRARGGGRTPAETPVQHRPAPRGRLRTRPCTRPWGGAVRARLLERWPFRSVYVEIASRCR